MCTWECAGGEPLALVRGVEEPDPDPEEDPEQHSQPLDSMMVPMAMFTYLEIDRMGYITRRERNPAVCLCVCIWACYVSTR